MDTIIIFPLISSTIVFFALGVGAYFDIRCRRSPKWVWTVSAPIALVFTLLWYIINFYWNGINAVLSVFILSMILCPFCMIMAYRRGNGGDWRALFYISLITPWLAPVTLLMSPLFGLVQVGVDWLRKSPVKSAWMVSITLAYFAAIVLYISSPY